MYSDEGFSTVLLGILGVEMQFENWEYWSAVGADRLEKQGSEGNSGF